MVSHLSWLYLLCNYNLDRVLFVQPSEVTEQSFLVHIWANQLRNHELSYGKAKC